MSPFRSCWRRSFIAGLLAGSPIQLGVMPFGIVYGVIARSLGLSLAASQGMSLIVFAGSSQLMFLDLWKEQVPLAVLIGTTLVVNFRHVMYSASIAPQLGPQTGIRGLLAGYLLTDEGYGVSISRFLSCPEFPFDKYWFYIGAALPTWIVWQISCLAGALAGSFIPQGNEVIAMAAPLVFLSLLLRVVRDKPNIAAAVAAGTTAIAGAALPYKFGFILAVFVGVIAGCWAKASKDAHLGRKEPA